MTGNTLEDSDIQFLQEGELHLLLCKYKCLLGMLITYAIKLNCFDTLRNHLINTYLYLNKGCLEHVY